MNHWLKRNDTIGLARAKIDSHTLGLSTLEELISESGFSGLIANDETAQAFSDPRKLENFSIIRNWILENRITVLGFSYRLSVDDGLLIFRRLMSQLKERGMLGEDGGPLKKVCFAGLPEACDAISALFKGKVDVFYGDESPSESFVKIGIDPKYLPEAISYKHPYDEFLEEHGRNIVHHTNYEQTRPPKRHGTPGYGTKKEHVVGRIEYAKSRGQPPLIRAHAGPYSPERQAGVKQFIDWCGTLARSGYLDVLSIGTSQLTQERFGEDWGDRPNGGGVPVNSSEEYGMIYAASRPMLVRVYAGTKNVPYLARIHEETLNIAWHALSLWWFSDIDGRGPHTVLENLGEHLETLKYIAFTGKPYEPNIPHHFAFRGSDDISYVVSAYIAARCAKNAGVRYLILQVMLNNPKYMWGVNDLAKARATLELVRKLEDRNFRVYLQSRVGLDYLSHDAEKAKCQLASVTALMDDIEAHDKASPSVIHVVSYSEGFELATPEIINESIQITLSSLEDYRALKQKKDVEDMNNHPDVVSRKQHLLRAAGVVIRTIEECITNPYSQGGLYEIFKLGFLPVPQLRFNRESYPEAIRWKTKVRKGCVDIYDGNRKVDVEDRMKWVKEQAAVDSKNRSH